MPFPIGNNALSTQTIMKRIARTITLPSLFLLYSHTHPLVAQWQNTHGPYGGNVYALAAIGQSLFAATDKGVYRSSNEGESWTAVNNGLVSKNVRALATSGSTILAGTLVSGIFRSTDNGQSWIAIGGSPTSYLRFALAMNGNYIFAGIDSMGGSFFRSSDNGATWGASTNGWPTGNVACFLFCDSVVLAGSEGGGVFRSTDDGSSWMPSNNGLTSCFVLSLLAKDSVIFAGTADHGIFRSTDNGLTWIAVNTGLPSALDIGIFGMAIMGNDVLVTTWGYGFYRSSDNGQSWYATGREVAAFYMNTVCTFGTSVFLGTVGAGVFASVDSGSHWYQASGGLPSAQIGALTVNGRTLFAGTQGGGLYASRDDGVSWESLNTGLSASYVSSLVTFGSSVVAATEGGGVFILAYGDTSWTPINNGLPDGASAWAEAVATNNHDLFVGYKFGGNVYASADTGRTWNPIGGPSDVDAIVAFDSVVLVGAFSGLYRTSDRGKSWTLVGGPMPFVNALLSADGNVFAGTDNGMYRSEDAGVHWTTTSGLSSGFVLAIAKSDAKMFAGAYAKGVYLSTDNGSSWSAVNTGLADLNVSSLAVFDSNVVAGTYSQGVWIRPISEMITGVSSSGQDPRSSFVLDQNYPNPFNPSTSIRFSLPSESHVRLAIYNLLGQTIVELQNGVLHAGNYERTWKANVASGLYLCRIEAVSVADPGKHFVDVMKILLLK